MTVKAIYTCSSVQSTETRVLTVVFYKAQSNTGGREHLRGSSQSVPLRNHHHVTGLVQKEVYWGGRKGNLEREGDREGQKERGRKDKRKRMAGKLWGRE